MLLQLASSAHARHHMPICRRTRRPIIIIRSHRRRRRPARQHEFIYIYIINYENFLCRCQIYWLYLCCLQTRFSTALLAPPNRTTQWHWTYFDNKFDVHTHKQRAGEPSAEEHVETIQQQHYVIIYYSSFIISCRAAPLVPSCLPLLSRACAEWATNKAVYCYFRYSVIKLLLYYYICICTISMCHTWLACILDWLWMSQYNNVRCCQSLCLCDVPAARAIITASPCVCVFGAAVAGTQACRCGVIFEFESRIAESVKPCQELAIAECRALKVYHT